MKNPLLGLRRQCMDGRIACGVLQREDEGGNARVMGGSVSKDDAGSRADAPAAENAAFVPIRLATLRVDRVARFDTFLEPGPGQPLVLYSERDVRFTEEARQRLVDNRVDTLYVHRDQLPEYNRYIQENLADLLAEEALPIEARADLLYSSASAVVEDVFAEPLAQESIQRSKGVVKNTVSMMLTDPHVFGYLLKVVAPDYRISTHSVNVVTYAVALAQRAGYGDAATLRELATGALLHDVGKTRVDSAILESPGPLSLEQWDALKKHPAEGHDMLASTDSLGEVALDIVRHHHEKVRGGGYPDGLAGDRISPFVRIVTIADVFDALTTHRPFQRARASFNALSLMTTQLAVDLDRELFRLFVGMMGNPALRVA